MSSELHCVSMGLMVDCSCFLLGQSEQNCSHFPDDRMTTPCLMLGCSVVWTTDRRRLGVQ